MDLQTKKKGYTWLTRYLSIRIRECEQSICLGAREHSSREHVPVWSCLYEAIMALIISVAVRLFLGKRTISIRAIFLSWWDIDRQHHVSLG